jgi:hypothetical protein
MLSEVSSENVRRDIGRVSGEASLLKEGNFKNGTNSL